MVYKKAIQEKNIFNERGRFFIKPYQANDKIPGYSCEWKIIDGKEPMFFYQCFGRETFITRKLQRR